jgi:hypothetical protein
VCQQRNSDLPPSPESRMDNRERGASRMSGRRSRDKGARAERPMVPLLPASALVVAPLSLGAEIAKAATAICSIKRRAA